MALHEVTVGDFPLMWSIFDWAIRPESECKHCAVSEDLPFDRTISALFDFTSKVLSTVPYSNPQTWRPSAKMNPFIH